MPDEHSPSTTHGELISDALLDRVAQRFRVLGDTRRLAILRLLTTHDELNVGEIVDALQTSQANVSKHLRQLLDEGIVARRPDGTSAYYRIADRSVERLCSIVCGRIEDQVEADATAVLRQPARRRSSTPV